MKRASVYCVFLVGFILISQVPGRSQVVDEPCRYWPLCSDTFLQYDSGGELGLLRILV